MSDRPLSSRVEPGFYWVRIRADGPAIPVWINGDGEWRFHGVEAYYDPTEAGREWVILGRARWTP